MTLILKPVAELRKKRIPARAARRRKVRQQLSDGVTRLCETFADVSEKAESPERYVWHTSDMEHYVGGGTHRL